MKSYMASNETIKRTWYIVDAEGKTLGRLATELAMVLQGKRKPIYTPHVDTGDYVIVINAEKVKLTGKKWDKKEYIYHTGYPGGLKRIPYKNLVEKHPTELIKLAVRGMLPKSSLGRQMMKKLKLYSGPTHPHEAQQPIELEF